MSKNIDNATKALRAELEAGHEDQTDLTAYLARLDEVVEIARQIKKLYSAEIAREASKKSRAKRAAAIAEMEARLAELESGTK